MKWSVLFVALVGLAACRRSLPRVEQAHGFPEQPPVIEAQPVDAKSYQIGYELGFAAGKAVATPQAKVPNAEEAQQLAEEVAAGDPMRNKKWREGWAGGYVEGFRARALHIK